MKAEVVVTWWIPFGMKRWTVRIDIGRLSYTGDKEYYSKSSAIHRAKVIATVFNPPLKIRVES